MVTLDPPDPPHRVPVVRGGPGILAVLLLLACGCDDSESTTLAQDIGAGEQPVPQDMGSPDSSAPDAAPPSHLSALAMVSQLASPIYSGRQSGTPGGSRAARYLAAQLQACGLSPAVEGTYFQTFKVTPIVHTGPMSLTVGPSSGGPSVALTYRSEWRPGRTSPAADLTAPLVFLGYGLDHAQHNDFKGFAVAGKLVMILQGCPPGLSGETLCGDGPKVERAATYKAAGVLLVAQEDGSIERWGGGQGHVLLPLPTAVVGPTATGKLLPAGQTLAALRKALEAGPASFDLQRTAHLVMNRTVYKDMDAHNVLGLWPGVTGDPRRLVVAGAHYDHLGIDQPPATYFPGALDNASGTAVVVDAACRMAARQVRPRRSLLFALWAAEEDGLLGSRYFVESGLVDLPALDAAVNLDMVGGKDKTELHVDVSPQALEPFRPILDRVLSRHDQSTVLDVIHTGNSDHASFHQRGVPTIYFYGPFPYGLEYHTLRDVPTQLSAESLDTQVEILTALLWELAQRP